MNRTEFIEWYGTFIKKALALNKKARKEGLLSLESDLDQEKVNERDIFEYGLYFVFEGTDPLIIEKILGNIIAQEKDEYTRIYKTIQKEAVMGIWGGFNTQAINAILNSLTDISLKDDAAYRERYEALDIKMAIILKALDEQMCVKPKNETDTDRPFTFEDIIWFDDRSVQLMFRELDTSDLAEALNTASQAVQGRIFKAMSRHGALMLKEYMDDHMWSMSEEDVQKARQKIIDIIMYLEKIGEIVIR